MNGRSMDTSMSFTELAAEEATKVYPWYDGY